jgi:hypothetical protein
MYPAQVLAVKQEVLQAGAAPLARLAAGVMGTEDPAELMG